MPPFRIPDQALESLIAPFVQSPELRDRGPFHAIARVHRGHD